MAQNKTVPTLKLGARYSSFEELEEAMLKYEDAKCAVYTIGNCLLVSKHNETAKDPLDPKLKYKTLVYTCKHFGVKRENHNLKGTRPNQRTFKKECPSRIRLTAFPQFLEVRKMEEEHNHELDIDLYKMYPEKRQLNDHEREKVGEMLEALAKPMLIQTKLSKFTTSYDIANVRTKNKNDVRKQYGSEKEYLYAILKEICDEGGRVIIGEERDESEDPNGAKKIIFVFFQTAQMRKNFEQYPEVVGMDSTYCVNANNMPLVVIRVTDRYGKGQSAGYALVTNEKLDIMKEVVLALIEASGNIVQNVQTVVVDKDYNEVTSIKECMPWVSVHLCLVHVLEAFKRNTKNEPNQAEVREILTKMAYAVKKTQYEEYFEDLQDAASDEFLTYFETHWAGYAAAWSSFERLNSYNLSQRTNNSVESHNQKIKTIVNRKSTLPELVKALLVLHANSSNNASYSDFLGLMKTNYRNDSNDPTLALILNSATPFAGQSMRVEYEMGLERVDMPDTVNYKNWKPSDDANSCNCPSFREKHLPCRHIFCLRQQKGLPLFSKEDVPERWQPVTGDTIKKRREDVANSYIRKGILSTNVLKTGGKALTQRERYKQASALCDEAANLISLCGNKQFTTKMKAVDTVLEIWRKGKEVMVLEANDDGHVIIDVPSSAPHIAVTNSKTDHGSDGELLLNQDKDTSKDTETSLIISESNDDSRGFLLTKSGSSKYQEISEERLKTLEIPKALKVRGRPKGQVLTRIGLKKKTIKKVHCEVCSKPGYWKTKRVCVDVAVDMLLCPVCQDMFKDHIKDVDIRDSQLEFEEDVDDVEELDPEKQIDFLLSDEEGEGNAEETSIIEPEQIIDEDSSDADESGSPSGPTPNRHEEEGEGNAKGTSIIELEENIDEDSSDADESGSPSGPTPNRHEEEGEVDDKETSIIEPEENVDEDCFDDSAPNIQTDSRISPLKQSAISNVTKPYVPVCNCGKVCIRGETTRGKNKGRFFYTCPEWTCKMKKFRFEDTLYNVTSPKKTEELCLCKLPVKKRTVLFGEHMGKVVSSCSKAKMSERCQYKQYTTAAGIGKEKEEDEVILPGPEMRKNVTIRKTQSGVGKEKEEDEVILPGPEMGKNVTIRKTQSAPECPVCIREGKPQVGGGHACGNCGDPVHSFGCSVTVEGADDGFGKKDKICIPCWKEGEENKRKRPQRAIQLPKRLRRSYMFDTP